MNLSAWGEGQPAINAGELNALFNKRVYTERDRRVVPYRAQGADGSPAVEGDEAPVLATALPVHERARFTVRA
jgi:hypothetical protein